MWTKEKYEEMENKRDEIRNKYPILFPPGECRCGFSCNLGWFKLLDNLFAELEEEIKNREDLLPEEFYIDQVKEKFGGLRVYMSKYDQGIGEIIQKYENIAYKTCEECGEPGEARGGGWIKTLCEKCDEERNSQLKGSK